MPSTLPAGVAASVPSVRLSSGYDMPLVGLGTSGLSGDKCTQAVKTALGLGFRHIDSAQMCATRLWRLLQACKRGCGGCVTLSFCL